MILDQQDDSADEETDVDAAMDQNCSEEVSQVSKKNVWSILKVVSG